MKTLTLCYVVFLAIAPIMILDGTSAHAEDLLVKSCSELVRMAENLQEDLKTVDIVLGSAIEAGKMDSIKNFKIKLISPLVRPCFNGKRSSNGLCAGRIKKFRVEDDVANCDFYLCRHRSLSFY